MKLVHHFTVAKEGVAVDLIHAATSLSKTAIKDCLNKGGIWLKTRSKKEQRIRKAKLILQPQDRISVYYDDSILQLPVPAPYCLFTCRQYSIWNKPAGLLSQGTRYGDHCSLMRFAEKNGAITTPYLIHRLDREASGLVLLAHSSKAAAQFSELFREGKIEKRYRAIAKGIVASEKDTFCIERPLNGKMASTTVTVVKHDQLLQQSTLDILLHTGRYHQIRQHLSAIGHPLVGDMRYGGGKKQEGLQLTACSLAFLCPFTQKQRKIVLD
ncbi:RluA family pseudouridine synthase [Desulfopila aestuarii]|uniref:tRNA pseudouridine32 synthase / 23S rRNA pseudouridine746 synthase n=1 Tax=Desulfopila aestuarii DSM 18488 TaxID=1121416 RepID=A0A1M7YKM5_9BACT|nr:RNA pseudouridine synthase [Desulfopila aestuarii]SHO53173.1 tRNA pseudouridine32 synthase / 23S rRNA pseudouridine746 synthase [Desulfopila aestuarii DSM 18488]